MEYKKRGPFLVFLVLTLLVSFSYFSLALDNVEGCYIYAGGSEDLYCQAGILTEEAQIDCNDHFDCILEEDFIPGSDCSEFSACQLITCSNDCLTHAQGKCDFVGGVEVPEDEYETYCNPGCCKIADQFCQFNLNKFECEQRASQLGIVNPIFDNSIGMDLDSCNDLYCHVEVQTSNLTVFVKDTLQNSLTAVNLNLEGTTFSGITNSLGQYTFLNINPGTYVVKASKNGYLPKSSSTTFGPNENIELELLMSKTESIAQISGEITTDNDQKVSGATISWSGPTTGQVFSDNVGMFTISSLSPGEYTLTISKIGYSSKSQIIELNLDDVFTSVYLEKSTGTEIKGKVFLDSNENEILDAEDKVLPGAKIYLDGLFKLYSYYPTGTFSISVDPVVEGQTYQIKSTYMDYVSKDVEVKVYPGVSQETPDLLLTRFFGECSLGNEKDVENFIVTPTPGKKVLELSWTRPCPEVTSYQIKKLIGDQEIDAFSISPQVRNYLDNDVDWGQSYTYQIQAIYESATSPQITEFGPVNVGDEECAGKYLNTGRWATFCLFGNEQKRRVIWSCTDENILFEKNNCQLNDEENLFCKEINSEVAECTDAGECSLSGDLFGLFYSPLNCYGTSDLENIDNFCYYDYTSTVTDQCKSCLEVESCFDYKSEDACNINNCLGSECSWIDGASNEELISYSSLNLPDYVTEETGHGYCVEKDYQQDDQCYLCSPISTIFENYYCTAEVCSGLGRCYSNPASLGKPLTSCLTCGEVPTKNANCYAYNTQLECEGQENVGITKNVYNQLSFSEDQCGWGRCKWVGNAEGYGSGLCIKDGNADDLDDCSTLSNFGSCKIDNTPPKTTILGTENKLTTFSYAHPEITFYGNEEENSPLSQQNSLGSLYYCLMDARDGSVESCKNSDYLKVDYSGSYKQNSLKVNLLESSFLAGKEVNGKTYLLKYFSLDEFFNQENVQETFIYIDNVKPQFEVQYINTTVKDTTELTINLVDLNEPMDCSFNLEQIFPAGASINKRSALEEQSKVVIFENLKGIHYLLNITCTDVNGNVNSEIKNLVFDLEKNIQIINPALDGSVASTKISFEVETSIGASCSLYTKDNEKVSDFNPLDDLGLKHRTPLISGFVEKEYPALYKVVCRDLYDSSKEYSDYFHFTVDFTPPLTKIVLTEGARTLTYLNNLWQEYFVDSVEVSFECSAQGFACDKTYYCFGEECDIIGLHYQEYTQPFTLEKSNRICYYSTDLGGSKIYSPVCGEIIIDGYGITLEKPSLYYYQNESWGISKFPLFDLQFSTKVPTSECALDFNPNFDYANTPSHQLKQINADGKYLFENFPESVFAQAYPENGGIKTIYLKCKNTEGEIGPEKSIYLEYDPTAPKIIDAYAQPENVLEGIFTTLFTTTDDKTMCKFSDNSVARGSDDYEQMEYGFPGNDEQTLDLSHQTDFYFNMADSDGGKKDFKLNVLCKNGAGDFSDLEELTFSVDYSAQGYLVAGSLKPQGYIYSSNVSLEVETSKNANCEYEYEGKYLPFAIGSGSKVHRQLLEDLQEKEYLIPIKCAMGDHLAYGEINFVIDFTPPTITKIDDGKYTCGQEDLQLNVYTDEETVGTYYYEVYDLGIVEDILNYTETEFEDVNSTKFNNLEEMYNYYLNSLDQNPTSNYERNSSTNKNARGNLVFNNTVDSLDELTITTTNLVAGHKYYVSVRVGDAINNWGEFKESDGFIIIPEDHLFCSDNSAPEIIYLTNETCTNTWVEIHYEDQIGVKTSTYSQSTSSASCSPEQNYNGQKILFDKTGWLCTYVADLMGNDQNATRTIIFHDLDGDGISDKCDLCSKTFAGKVVNDFGCADGEEPDLDKRPDTDGDGLPDYWEKQYDDYHCEFDFENVDSDFNNLDDDEEDYDNDGYTNLEEYQADQNPCVQNTPRDELPGYGDWEYNLTEEPPTSGDFEFPTDITIPSETVNATNVWAWVILLLGLLLIVSGSAYLTYYYLYSPEAISSRTMASRPILPTPKIKSAEPRTFTDNIKEKLFSLRKKREQKERRRRESIFGEFTPESPSIPHVEDLLNKKAPHLSKLQELSTRYKEHKQEINSGLKQEEKSLFSKLDQISKETKNKNIEKVVSKEEAKDIFAELKKLSKKRKE